MKSLETRFCWDRPRLIASWLLWLPVLPLLVLPKTGYFLLLLFSLALSFRPANEEREASQPAGSNLRVAIGGAIGLLIGLPLFFVIYGSPAAMTFLRTPLGIALLFAVSLPGIAGDFKRYRQLPPF